MAVDFIERNPLPVEAAAPATPQKNVRAKRNKVTRVTIPEELQERFSAAIARHNSVAGSPITYNDGIVKAIEQFVERVPVEFIDPELARELREQDVHNG